jgi:hypothetical protein
MKLPQSLKKFDTKIRKFFKRSDADQRAPGPAPIVSNPAVTAAAPNVMPSESRDTRLMSAILEEHAGVTDSPDHDAREGPRKSLSLSEESRERLLDNDNTIFLKYEKQNPASRNLEGARKFKDFLHDRGDALSDETIYGNFIGWVRNASLLRQGHVEGAKAYCDLASKEGYIPEAVNSQIQGLRSDIRGQEEFRREADIHELPSDRDFERRPNLEESKLYGRLKALGEQGDYIGIILDRTFSYVGLEDEAENFAKVEKDSNLIKDAVFDEAIACKIQPPSNARLLADVRDGKISYIQSDSIDAELLDSPSFVRLVVKSENGKDFIDLHPEYKTKNRELRERIGPAYDIYAENTKKKPPGADRNDAIAYQAEIFAKMPDYWTDERRQSLNERIHEMPTGPAHTRASNAEHEVQAAIDMQSSSLRASGQQTLPHNTSFFRSVIRRSSGSSSQGHTR